jgi:predicted nucleic acid-binding protein
VRFTLDSNILIYAADSQGGRRHIDSLDLLRRAVRADCILTLQSLGEFFHATTRKGKLSATGAQAFIDDWRAVLPVHAADSDTLTDAINAVRRDTMSFWDAMLWAAARRAGCRLLLSEDLHDGQTMGGVRFVNPFEPKNAMLIDTALPPVA